MTEIEQVHGDFLLVWVLICFDFVLDQGKGVGYT